MNRQLFFESATIAAMQGLLTFYGGNKVTATEVAQMAITRAQALVHSMDKHLEKDNEKDDRIDNLEYKIDSLVQMIEANHPEWINKPLEIRV